MVVIMTIGRESLLLKNDAIKAMAGFLQDAKSVSKDYTGKWKVNSREHIPVIEFTVLTGDIEETKDKSEKEQEE